MGVGVGVGVGAGTLVAAIAVEVTLPLPLAEARVENTSAAARRPGRTTAGGQYWLEELRDLSGGTLQLNPRIFLRWIFRYRNSIVGDRKAPRMGKTGAELALFQESQSS